MQAFGAGGVADAVLAQAYIYTRAGHIVDGADGVHRAQLASLELRKLVDLGKGRSGASTTVTIAQGVNHLPRTDATVTAAA
jgi:hypothetical protein